MSLGYRSPHFTTRSEEENCLHPIYQKGSRSQSNKTLRILSLQLRGNSYAYLVGDRISVKSGVESHAFPECVSFELNSSIVEYGSSKSPGFPKITAEQKLVDTSFQMLKDHTFKRFPEVCQRREFETIKTL
ncbi:hypothetical protein J6590_033092 [Homalodisca vitripennis]|nr:hypothetical protein J6590_033092 [Homalodisca vitripennis]